MADSQDSRIPLKQHNYEKTPTLRILPGPKTCLPKTQVKMTVFCSWSHLHDETICLQPPGKQITTKKITILYRLHLSSITDKWYGSVFIVGYYLLSIGLSHLVSSKTNKHMDTCAIPRPLPRWFPPPRDLKSPLPFDFWMTSSFTMSITSSGILRYLMVLPRM